MAVRGGLTVVYEDSDRLAVANYVIFQCDAA